MENAGAQFVQTKNPPQKRFETDDDPRYHSNCIETMPLCGFRQTLCTHAAAHGERLLGGGYSDLSFPDSEGIEPCLTIPAFHHRRLSGSCIEQDSVFVNVFPWKCLYYSTTAPLCQVCKTGRKSAHCPAKIVKKRQRDFSL